MKKHIFPLCFIFNSLSLSLLVIAFSFSGNEIFAAEISVMQAAISGLLYALSSNSRVTILSGRDNIFDKLLVLRIYALIPLVYLSYILVGAIGEFNLFLFVVILLRRISEWIADLFLSDLERESNYSKGIIFIIVQAILLCLLVYNIYRGLNYYLLIIIWCISPIVVYSWFKFKNSFIIYYIPSKIFNNYDITHFGSSIVIGLTLFIFRASVVTIFGKETAGSLLSAFAIGGMMGAIFATSYAPTLAKNELETEGIHFNKRFHLILIPLFIAIGSYLIYLPFIENTPVIFHEKSNLFWSAVGYSCFASVIIYYAQLYRNRLLIVSKDNVLFGADILASISTIFSINLLYLIFGINGGAALALVQSILMLIFYISSYRTSNSIFILSFYAILCLIALPVFFKVEISNLSSINSIAVMFDVNVYFPISFFFIFLFLILIGNFQNAKNSFICISIYYIIIYLSYFFVTNNDSNDWIKLLTITKYLLPPLALVLGEIVGKSIRSKQISNRDLFFFLLIVIIFILTNYNFDIIFFQFSLQIFYVLISIFLILLIDKFSFLFNIQFVLLKYASINKLYLYSCWFICFCIYIIYVLYTNKIFESNFFNVLFGNGIINTENYYIASSNLITDIILSYGIAPSLPFLLLLIFTIIRSINYTSKYHILIILLITIHLCFVENSGPYNFYAGIFVFFLWGYYISSFGQPLSNFLTPIKVK